MPSGAKKRKAAKRKKELGVIYSDSPTNIQQGNHGMVDEGLNRHDHDGEESEGGESGSSTSQENHPFVAEEEGGEDKQKKGDFPDLRATQELMESSENGSKEHGEPVLTQKLSEEVFFDTATERTEEEILSPPPPPAAPNETPEGGEDKQKKGDFPDLRATQEMESSENGSKEHGEPVITQKLPEEVSDTATERTEEEILSTPPPPPPDETIPEDVIVDHVQTEKGEDVGGLEEMSRPAENPTERVVEKAPVELDPSGLPSQEGSSSVSKEVVQDTDTLVETQTRSVSNSEEKTQVSDVPIENLEGLAAAETSSESNEEQAVPLSATVSGYDDSGEHGPGNESREIGETAEAVRPPHVAHRASWTSCCGLFDALTGSGR